MNLTSLKTDCGHACKFAPSLLWLIAILFLVSMAVCSPSWARTKNKAATAVTSTTAQYVTIPVLYVTDRETSGESFGAHRRYPSHCQHQMYYGTSFVTVKNTAMKENTDLFQRLGWQATNEKPAKIAAKQKIDPNDPVKAKSAFFQSVANELDKSKKNELCLFVHGAADAFEDCSLDAAQLAYSMEKPVVLYSWPSDPKWRGYFIDSTNNEWSQGHFNMFCKDLLELRKTHPLEILSFSHSMGNRLVIRALPVVFTTGLVTSWSLISPDIDADTCRHYTMGMTPPVTAKIRLYVSNKDKMLPLAQMLAGGYYRLGEAANPAAIPPEWNQTPSHALMERIDFTEIDHGLSGHSIPFDLVANMINTGTPGEGLSLVPETEVRGNRLVKFADKSQHLDRMTKGLPNEYCKRVVREKELTRKK